MSIARYTAIMASTHGPRETELRAFRYVNGLLAGAGDDVAARAVALRKNFQLWSTLLSDLMLPTNALPAELKAHLASLSLWAQNESNRALRDDHAGLDAMIAVNRDMIEALEAQARPAAPTAPAPVRPAASSQAAPARIAASLAAMA